MILKFLSQELEKAFILVALRACDGNVYKASIALEIPYKTLWTIIKRRNIAVEGFKKKKPIRRRLNSRIQRHNRGFYGTKFKLVMEALERNNGHRGRTASDLGISVRSVGYWISEALEAGYRVTPPSVRGKK